MFTKETIQETFEKIGHILKEPVTIYLIGGGAMSLVDLKLVTKDIDIVVTNKKDLTTLRTAFQELGFKTPQHLVEEIYLTALAVFVKEESRIDLFLKEVCKKLQFSPAMQKRANHIATYDKLIVKAASNEDIFLFKSLAYEAGREHDLVDCSNLFRRGLNWDVIVEECVAQHKDDTKWVFWLYEFICHFENQEGIVLPIKERVFQLCREEWEKRPDDWMEDIANPEKHLLKEFLKDLKS